jgi:TetR/AcrR family transcriptional regulator
MLKKRIHREKRRELIVKAALDVFSKKGYDGSTIKKISERAQITQGLIYCHFKSKRDLYETITKNYPTRWFFSSEDMGKIMSGDDDRKIFKNFARCYLEVMRRNEQLLKFINFGQLENPHLFKVSPTKSSCSPLAILSNYSKKRIKERKLKKKKAGLAVRIFLGMIHWYGLRSIIAKAKGWEVYNEDEVIDTIVDIYLYGMITKSVKKESEAQASGL